MERPPKHTTHRFLQVQHFDKFVSAVMSKKHPPPLQLSFGIVYVSCHSFPLFFFLFSQESAAFREGVTCWCQWSIPTDAFFPPFCFQRNTRQFFSIPGLHFAARKAAASLAIFFLSHSLRRPSFYFGTARTPLPPTYANDRSWPL